MAKSKRARQTEREPVFCSCLWNGQRSPGSQKPCPACGGLASAFIGRAEWIVAFREIAADRAQLTIDRPDRLTPLGPPPKALAILTVDTGRVRHFTIPAGMKAKDQSQRQRPRRFVAR